MSLWTKIRGLREVWAFDNRLWLVLTKTFFRREHLHVYRYNGLDILVDHAGGDANGAREVLTSTMYRRFLPLMKFEGSANVLDLGASNGGFPLLLASSGIELKKVVSLELNPHTFVRLQFNLLRNLDCETYPVNAAVCGESRILDVVLGRGGSSDNIYGSGESAGRETHKIQGLTFDQIFSEYFDGEIVDLCKIDVEGAEFEIFSRPSHKLLARCRYLLIEIHAGQGRRLEEIRLSIEALGFVREPLGDEPNAEVQFFSNSAYTK